MNGTALNGGGATSRGVAVVGSANLDIVVRLDRFPAPGETVLGRALEHVAGGKGLNQATAAARHTSCAFVGSVGTDEAGDVLIRHLETAGVDTAHLSPVDEATGRAFIQVNAAGENTIVVLSSANQRLTADAVGSALDSLRPAVVMTQLEIPLEAVQAAAEWTVGQGARFVLNASPVRELPRALLAACDPLVVNTGEAIALLGDAPPESATGRQAPDHAATLAGRLAERVRTVVVTDGARGVTVATAPTDITHVPGLPVQAVDTTGAGDEFAGALAGALANGRSLPSAAEVANRAAARIVALPRTER